MDTPGWYVLATFSSGKSVFATLGPYVTRALAEQKAAGRAWSATGWSGPRTTYPVPAAMCTSAVASQRRRRLAS